MDLYIATTVIGYCHEIAIRLTLGHKALGIIDATIHYTIYTDVFCFVTSVVEI